MELCALYVVLCVWYALTCVMCRMCMPLVIVIVYPYHFVQYVHMYVHTFIQCYCALINVLVKYGLCVLTYVWCALTCVVSCVHTICTVWLALSNVICHMWTPFVMCGVL